MSTEVTVRVGRHMVRNRFEARRDAVRWGLALIERGIADAAVGMTVRAVTDDETKEPESGAPVDPAEWRAETPGKEI